MREQYPLFPIMSTEKSHNDNKNIQDYSNITPASLQKGILNNSTNNTFCTMYFKQSPQHKEKQGFRFITDKKDAINSSSVLNVRRINRFRD